MVVLAVSGGSALAATQGSSNSSKPDVRPAAKPHKATSHGIRSGHDCPFSRANATAADL
jgi:hypothetical protein